MPTPQPNTASDAELLDALAAGATVATGNARLARSLAAAYERRMLAEGRTAWPTPAVLPLSAWLQDAWEETSLRAPEPLPRVLGSQQEMQLWGAVIAGDARARLPALLNADAAARPARDAYALLCDHELDLDDRRFNHSENPAAFRRWARAFRARGRERGEVAAAELPALLAPHVRDGLCPVPARLVLAGFYELTPALQALSEALQAAGARVEWLEPAGAAGAARSAFRVQADDPRDELQRVADWAGALLQARPDARIGVVVPDLQARRAALEHALRRRLDPASLKPGAPPAPRPWNISLGRPLADYPVVATALRLLSLAASPVQSETLSLLLLSPHWALPDDAGERFAELDRRALLDRRLRSLGDARLPLSTVVYEAGGGGGRDPLPWHTGCVAQRFAALRRMAEELPSPTGAAGWAAAFSGWLKTADWAAWGAGGRPLDSREYQAMEAFHDVLSTLSSLEDFAGPLELGEALALLGRLAAETPFQPRSGEASVQVLGLYEAIGQSFDHLWVMGLHDGAWPPAPGPDPYLPVALQREKGLPHSDPDIELAWARQVTERLLAAAPEVIFSYPGRDGDEELQCSPLIASLPPLEPDRQAHGQPGGEADAGWQARVRASGTAEAAPAPAAVPLADPRVRGGSRLFADQAACPFRAFAAHRLAAEPLERPQAGLDAMRRGTLMHRLLARVWEELETQERLLALDETALRERLRPHIEELLEAGRRRSPATFTARFRMVEARRLEDRAVAWLALERERSPFRVVAREQATPFESGGVAVQLYVDRVDELEDGSRLVLDYKTGRVSAAAWFGERPEEPQLPLYGVALRAAQPEAPMAGVAFAQVRAEQSAFAGVVREAGLLPGLPGNRKGALKEAAEHWPAVLDEWAAELEGLARRFAAGTAEVDPKRGLATCDRTYCELGRLCRIRASLSPAAEADDDTPGDAEAGGGHGA